MYFALLDLLRFISAMAVMFHHTFSLYYGKLGVYLFFIISGFVIYFSLQKGVKDYIVSRFLRLYPLFWVCITITFLITVMYGINVPVKKYLLDMLMFNDGKIDLLVDGSYWTLTFELLFYFYIGVFVWIFSTKKLEWFYFSWLLYSFLSFFLEFDQHIISKLLCVRFAPYFIFGGILALIIDRYKVSSLKKRVFYLFTLLASAIMPIYVDNRLLAQRGSITNLTGSFDGYGILIVESFFIIMLIFVFLSYYVKSKSLSKIFLALGGITYPLYLLHWKISETIISKYSEFGKLTLFSVYFAIALTLFSYILSVYDLKIRKILRKKILGY